MTWVVSSGDPRIRKARHICLDFPLLFSLLTRLRCLAVGYDLSGSAVYMLTGLWSPRWRSVNRKRRVAVFWHVMRMISVRDLEIGLRIKDTQRIGNHERDKNADNPEQNPTSAIIHSDPVVHHGNP